MLRRLQTAEQIEAALHAEGVGVPGQAHFTLGLVTVTLQVADGTQPAAVEGNIAPQTGATASYCA